MKIHDVCAYTDPAKLTKPTAADWSNILNDSVRSPSVVLTGCKRPDNCASETGELCAGCDCEVIQPIDKSVLSILESAVETFKSRNSVYGDLFDISGNAIADLFPEGIELKTPEEFGRFAQFLLCYGKLARYAVNLKTGGHADSAHDLIVSAAILERLTKQV